MSVKQERYNVGDDIDHFPDFDEDRYLSEQRSSDYEKYEKTYIVPNKDDFSEFSIISIGRGGINCYNFEQDDRLIRPLDGITQHIRSILNIYGFRIYSSTIDEQMRFD